MRLTEVRREQRDGLVRLVGTVVRQNQPPFELFYEFEERFADLVSDRPDPFAAALLVPAMYWGLDLKIEVPISQHLCASLPEIQSVFLSWYPRMRRSHLELFPAAPFERPSGTAAFFSGGIDWFYTLVKHCGNAPISQPLSHLIFMKGMETPLQESQGVNSSLDNVRAVADQYGLTCLWGRTNLRTFFVYHYERYFVGSALASVALALGRGLGTVHIPSTCGYHNLRADGSNLITDPLYSTEYTRILYDGAEATRSAKTEMILQRDAETALQYLRVCTANDGGAFNCGRCHKCVRTQIALTLLGKEEVGQLFQSRSPAQWPKALMADHFDYLLDHIALARRTNANPSLVRMLERTVHRRERNAAIVALLKHAQPFRTLLPLLRRTRDMVGVEARDRNK